MRDDQASKTHGQLARARPNGSLSAATVAGPAAASEVTQITGPTGHAHPAHTQPSGRGPVVADALEHLADQIKQAASELRQPDIEAASSESRQVAWWDPRSVVDLVMYELSKRGIKSNFGPEADLSSAERSAAQLLSDLGVAIPDARQTARPCDPA